ncbi:hypothetical protein ACFPM0_28700 [Pseudonocardia sulfidoxydans]
MRWPEPQPLADPGRFKLREDRRLHEPVAQRHRADAARFEQRSVVCRRA